MYLRNLFQISSKKLALGFLALAVILGTFFTARTSVITVFKASTRKLPIYCVETERKAVAITFDAAWGAADTDLLISILKEHNVKATFFICGYWAEKFPVETKKFFDAGHDIANHSDSHAHVTELDLEQNKKEIIDAHEKIKKLLGIEMNLYRPPFGEYNSNVIESAEELGYYTIQWDVEMISIDSL